MAESVEYRALLECFDSLVTALKFDPVLIADELVAKGLVPPGVVSNQRSDSERAHELAGKILDKVKLAPDRYHDVFRLLSKHQWMEDFVKILKITYDQNRAAHIEENSKRNPGGKDPSEPVFIEFSCDLGDIPQCKSSFEVTNPIVRFSDLDDDDLEDLHAQIDKLTKRIELEFGRFFDKVFTSFRDSQKVDRDRLVLTLVSKEKLFKEDDLAGTTSVYDVFKVIRPYCSYFNYDILERLVQINGLPQDKCYLKEYIQAFSAYCKAVPCVETVCGSDHKDTKSKRVKLKFKLDYDRQQLKPDVVRSIKWKIADHLGVKPSALYLYRIEEGCISLEFLVPIFILEDLLPLTSTQKAALRQDVKVKALGIECEALNVNVQFEEKSSPMSKKGEESHPATYYVLSKSLPDLTTMPTIALGKSKEVSMSADNITALCCRKVDLYTTSALDLLCSPAESCNLGHPHNIKSHSPYRDCRSSSGSSRLSSYNGHIGLELSISSLHLYKQKPLQESASSLYRDSGSYSDMSSLQSILVFPYGVQEQSCSAGVQSSSFSARVQSSSSSVQSSPSASLSSFQISLPSTYQQSEHADEGIGLGEHHSQNQLESVPQRRTLAASIGTKTSSDHDLHRSKVQSRYSRCLLM